MKYRLNYFICALLLSIADLPPSNAYEVAKVDSSVDAINTVLGNSRLIRFDTPIAKVAIGDPSIADYRILSPTEMILLGKAVGTTNMILWQQNQQINNIDVTVSIDLNPLSNILKRELPNENDIQLLAASGSIVLSGSVSSTVDADKVISLAEAHARNLNRYMNGGFKEGGGMSTQPSATASMIQVINALSIRNPQQVMLEVKIAEVSKKLLDQLGVGINGLSNNMLLKVAANSVAPGSTSILYSKLFQSSTKNNAEIQAEHDDTLVKILAEPTLVSSNGQEGSFLVGGRIFIPVTQSTGGLTGGVVTLVEREYGVGLKFVPTILDGGRISLKVAPEVSQISKDVTVQTGGSDTIPSFTTRKVSSTVQMNDGEYLVIGGLIQNNAIENMKAFPFLGQLPVLGALFRSSEFTSDKTELVIVITPRLVRGVKESPQLPTDSFVAPTRSEGLIGGKFEGNQ